MSKYRTEAAKQILIRLTFDGGFQRSKIYKSASSAQRIAFRKDLADLLFEFKEKAAAPRYSEKKHFETLRWFSLTITRKHKAILNGGKFRLGTTQKFVNLFWKLCWLTNPRFPRPIHCPFDRVIIQKLDKSVRGIKWTTFDKISEYKKLVKYAHEASGKKKSIAEWEVNEYLKYLKKTSRNS